MAPLAGNGPQDIWIPPGVPSGTESPGCVLRLAKPHHKRWRAASARTGHAA